MRFRRAIISILFITLLGFNSTLKAQDEVVKVVNEYLEDQQSRSLNGLNGEELFNDLLKIYQNPIAINAASREDLEQLPFLSDYQIENLLYYVYTSGALLSVYELKAVHGLDSKTIQWLLPFIYLDEQKKPQKRSYFNQQILARYSRIAQAQKGFEVDSGNRFLGDPNAILIRMDGNYGQTLSWHFLAEKDRGELSYSDFLSGGIGFNGQGFVHKVVLGDYKVRAGQGLITWSGNAHGKNMELDQIRRKGETLSLYGSSRETGYYRGGAIQLYHKNVELDLWASQIPIDANTDSLNEEQILKTIYEDGLHNTSSKLAAKHAANLSAYGAHFNWNNPWFRPGFTYLYQPLNIPLVKVSDESFVQIPPLDQWHSYSVDFFTSIRHMHIWGEMAMQSHGSSAGIFGLQFFANDAIQSSLIYRRYSPDFYSVYGSAFGETGNPTNENGLYLGLKVIPGFKLSIHSSVDIYHFPWLKYQQTFTSSGFEGFLKASYAFDRYQMAYVQLRYEERLKTVNTQIQPMDDLKLEQRSSLRLNYESDISSQLSITSRIEFSAYKLQTFQTGVMLLQDISYQLNSIPIQFNGRFAWFNTSDYASRIYAYERDILYAFSVPAYYGNGVRTFVNLKYQPAKSVRIWLRYARTAYFDRDVVGSGLDEIEGSKRDELKLQLQLKF